MSKYTKCCINEVNFLLLYVMQLQYLVFEDLKLFYYPFSLGLPNIYGLDHAREALMKVTYDAPTFK